MRPSGSGEPVQILNFIGAVIHGLTVKRLLGKGRSASVYELRGRLPCTAQRSVAAKIFFDTDAGKAGKEHALARWADAKGIGPAVFNLLEMQVDDSPDVPKRPLFLVEKMDFSLARASHHLSFAKAQSCWRETFGLLESTAFQVSDANQDLPSPEVGWLCGDDLKLDNALVSLPRSGTCDCQEITVKFIDWDHDHWHVLPLGERDGANFNVVFFMLNSLLTAPRVGNSLSLPRLTGIWPEDKRHFLLSLVALAKKDDRVLLNFVKVFDVFLARGPYHYARIQGPDRKQRIYSFVSVLAAFHAPSLSTEQDVIACRHILQRLARAYQARERAPMKPACAEA